MKKLLTLLLCLLPVCSWATKSNITLADTAVVAAGKVLQVTGRIQADSIFSGNKVVSPSFSSAWTAGKRVRGNLFDLDTLRLRDSLTVSAGSKTKFLPGSIFQAAAITPDSILGTVLATGIFNIGTASNFKLAGTAATFGMAGLNAVTDGSVLTTQHYHSALSASDGSPNPALSVDATGNLTTAAVNNTSFTFDSGTGETHTYDLIHKGSYAEINGIQFRQGSTSYGNNQMYFITQNSGGTLQNTLILDQATGSKLLLGDGTTTTNTDGTIMFSIDQRANDDDIINFRSSDVATGMTTIRQTDIWGSVRKSQAASGGLSLLGLDDGGGNPWGATLISGILGQAADATATASGHGVIRLDATVKFSTGNTSVAASGNILSVENRSSTQLLLTGDGHLYTNDVAATYDYDDEGKPHDDVAMISTLDRLHAQMSDKKLVDSEWEDFKRYNEVDLIKVGILGGPITNVDPTKRGMLNLTGLVKWHNGAIRQLGRSVGETEYRVKSIEARVAELEMRELFYSPTIWGRN